MNKKSSGQPSLFSFPFCRRPPFLHFLVENYYVFTQAVGNYPPYFVSSLFPLMAEQGNLIPFCMYLPQCFSQGRGFHAQLPLSSFRSFRSLNCSHILLYPTVSHRLSCCLIICAYKFNIYVEQIIRNGISKLPKVCIFKFDRCC